MDTETITGDMRMPAAKGAIMLDEKRPGWHWQVNLELLDLETCTRCVLGQLGGGLAFMLRRTADHAADPYQAQLTELEIAGADEAAYGFTLDGRYHGPEEWLTLTAAWKEEITKRREADDAAG